MTKESYFAVFPLNIRGSPKVLPGELLVLPGELFQDFETPIYTFSKESLERKSNRWSRPKLVGTRPNSSLPSQVSWETYVPSYIKF